VLCAAAVCCRQAHDGEPCQAPSVPAHRHAAAVHTDNHHGGHAQGTAGCPCIQTR
jgi:hypothetical protein